jgi:hypothetical protein
MSRQATMKDLRPGIWVCSHDDDKDECDLYMIIGKRSGSANGALISPGSDGHHWMMYSETRNAWDIWEWEKYLINKEFYVIHGEDGS